VEAFSDVSICAKLVNCVDREDLEGIAPQLEDGVVTLPLLRVQGEEAGTVAGVISAHRMRRVFSDRQYGCAAQCSHSCAAHCFIPRPNATFACS
jgi:hypothetical protein